MECEPTASTEVLRVADPELSAPVPSVVVPSLKVTVPVGVPAPGASAFTIAVNVTGCPNTEGLVELASDVVVLAVFTVCVKIAEVLVAKLLLPP